MNGLPVYTEQVSEPARAVDGDGKALPQWHFRFLGVIGVLLVALPLVTGMFLRAAQGQRLLADFAPYLTDDRVMALRTDLATVSRARDALVTLRAQGRMPSGNYPYVDALIRDYPAIVRDMSGMVDAMAAEQHDYRSLAALPSFGLLPWFFALPGFVLFVVAVLGVRRAGDGRRTLALYGVALLIAIGLIAAPMAFGVFQRAPAAAPLLHRFSPILTHERVRTVQGYFVTLVGGEGELDSRLAAQLRATVSGAELAGIDELRARWQPMTARFAGLVGAMNDNVANVAGVVALDDSTKPLGFPLFRWLGWFFLLPGLAAAGTIGFAIGPARYRSQEVS